MSSVRAVFLDAPRGLANAARVAEREQMLAERAEVQPLWAYAEALAARRKVLVPRPDPADAGVEARVLIVLEAPGPMAVNGARPGSGFISVDNDDPTAENLWRARDAAGLHEDCTVVWNVVPWYLGSGSIHPRAGERESGAAELRRFMQLLPSLRVVVLGGKHAQNGWKQHIDHLLDERLTFIPVPHPAAQSLLQAGAREKLARGLERAATYL